MRRTTATPLAALALVVGLLAGTTASAATANDAACRKATVSGSPSTTELLAYDACRFDRLDAAVAALKPISPSPSPSVTTPPTASTAPTSPGPTLVPTSSPSPTSSPTLGAKPGPSNTGVPDGTTLTAYTGPTTITTAGTVIDGKDVSSALRIEAKNVVIRNSKIHGSDAIGIDTTDSGGLTISDSEVYDFETGLVYSNFTAVRLDLHDLSYDGVKLSSNATVRDSWIHAPKPTPDAHWDGIQVQNGVVNTLIQGNNIDPSGADTNSALFLCPDLGPTTAGPLTVTGNWLNGGNFTVNVLDGNNGQYFIRDIRVTNNRFGPDHKYGYSNVNVPITQSGNVVDATGAPLAL